MRSTAQVRSMGGIDPTGLPVFDGEDAVAPVIDTMTEIRFEDLAPELQAEVREALAQLEAQIPAEAMAQVLPMLAKQLEGQIPLAPEEERPAAIWLLQELHRRIDAMPPAGADPIPQP
jgi:hypothetical protein